jgi:hypothetical protein
MSFECPNCKSNLQPQDLKNEWGCGTHCVLCGAKVRYSPPYHLIILFGSLPFLIAELAVRGIEQGLLASIIMVIIWFFGSIYLAIFISWIRPPKLKLECDEDLYSPPSILK